MQGSKFFLTSVLLTVLLISTVSGIKQQRIAPPNKPAKPAPKPALVKKTMNTGQTGIDKSPIRSGISKTTTPRAAQSPTCALGIYSIVNRR